MICLQSKLHWNFLHIWQELQYRDSRLLVTYEIKKELQFIPLEKDICSSCCVDIVEGRNTFEHLLSVTRTMWQLWLFQLRHKLCWSCFQDFSASCVEVMFNFCPGWAEVVFWTSDQVDRKSVIYFRQVVGKLVLKILSKLGRIIFLWIFLEMLLKTPFSSATIWREIFSEITPQNAVPIGYHLEKHFEKLQPTHA